MKNSESVDYWNFKNSIAFFCGSIILFLFSYYFLFQPLLNLTAVNFVMVVLVSIVYASVRWGIVDGSVVMFGFVASFLIGKLQKRMSCKVLAGKDLTTGFLVAFLDALLVGFCFWIAMLTGPVKLEMSLMVVVKVFFVFGLPGVLDCFFVVYSKRCNDMPLSDRIRTV